MKKIIFILIFIMCIIPISAWESSLEDGLIAWYDFESYGDGSIVRDETNNNLNMNGTISDTSHVNYTISGAGKIGRGMEFDSTGGNISSISLIPAIGDINRSVFGWVNLSGGSAYNILAAWGADSQNNNQSNFACASDLANLYFSTRNTISLSPSTGISDTNDFHFIGYIYNATSSNITFYLDGSYLNSTTLATDLTTGSSLLTLGQSIEVADDWDFEGIMDEVGIWNRTLSEAEVTSLYNGGLGTTFGDVGPTITLNSPENGISTINDTIIFNCSAESIEGVLNLTLIIDDIHNQTITNTSAYQNLSIESTFPIIIGNHNWSCISSNINTQTNSDTRTLTRSYFTEESQVYNTTIYETARENFIINITFNSSKYTIPKALFFIGGTSYTGTTTNTGNNRLYNVNFDIPVTTNSSSRNIYWEFNFSSGKGNSTINSITHSPINFSLCNTVNNISFLNITFENETAALEKINATLNSVFTVYLGQGSVNRTFSIISTTENSSYGICVNPSFETLYGNYSIIYDNSESQQRNTQSTFTLTNFTTNLSLKLLPTEEGIFVTFQVIDATESIISGVTANVTLNGNLIDSGTTDDAGTITFFLDPDSTYVFTFYKSGYNIYSTTLTPTQTEYTITLGGAETIEDDFTRGISFAVEPIDKTLFNETYYEFNYTLTSSYWTVTDFGFVLFNGSNTKLNESADTGNGGFVSATINTANHTSLIMNLYWIIDGNYTNSTIVWYIVDSSGTGFGLNNFFNRLSSYLSDEIFGIDNFALMIIIYIIIFIFTGIMSYKYGFNNTTLLLFIVFSLVYFFDNILNLIPSPPGISSEVPVATIAIGLLLIGSFIWEIRK